MIDWRDRHLRNRARTEAVILHHTEGRPIATAEEIDRVHLSRGWAGIGYHYLVRRRRGAWIVDEGRPHWATGAHAPGWNSRSLAIAIAGSYTSRPPHGEAIDRVVGTIVRLRSHYGKLRVIGHSEAMAEIGREGYTSCPGDLAWVHRIRELLPADGPA